MSVYVANIILYTDTDFEQTFVLESADSQKLLYLKDYTGVSEFKRYNNSSVAGSFDISFPNQYDGRIKISIGANQTSSLKSGKYFYDIKLTSPSGTTSRVVEGQLLIKKSITR